MLVNPMQVDLPDVLHQPSLAIELFKGVLCSQPQDRPTAAQVQARLHDILVQEGWSNSLLDGGSSGMSKC